MPRLVQAISEADYRGEVSKLTTLATQAARLAAQDTTPANPAMYWHAFALWRTVLNAVDDGVGADGVAHLLDQADEAFEAMLRQDPQHEEARIGLLGVLQVRMFLWPPPHPRFAPTLARAVPLMASLRRDAPGNPRAAWPIASLLYRTPPAAGGGKDVAIAYAREVLALPDKPPAPSGNQPTWGRPELLATLAFMLADRNGPNLAAQRTVNAALALQPEWRYALRTLLPSVSPKPASNSQEPPPEAKAAVVARTIRLPHGDVAVRVETTLPQTPEQVWPWFSTEPGLRCWVAPQVRLDLRTGGSLQTHYDAAAQLGDPGTTFLDVLNVVPAEVLTLKIKFTDAFAPRLRADDGRLQEVIQLQRLPGGGTRVVSTMLGWGNGAEWDQAMAFFERGNTWSYQQLARCAISN